MTKAKSRNRNYAYDVVHQLKRREQDNGNTAWCNENAGKHTRYYLPKTNAEVDDEINRFLMELNVEGVAYSNEGEK